MIGFLLGEDATLLDHVLKFVTFGTVIIGCVAILTAVHTNNRRVGAEIFLKYSERISDLRLRLPSAAFFGNDEIELAPDERRVAQEIIYSVFELFELREHGIFPSAIWKIREADAVALLALPAFSRETTVLRNALAHHPRFLAWTEHVARV